MAQEESVHRKLAAIMFTDMVGYTALTQRNEKLALELLEEHRRVLRELFPKFNGREIETTGDGFLVEFASALEAARCAIEIQRTLATRNISVPPENQIHVRIGIHVGDVVQKEGRLLGDGVNIAARLQPLAEPGGICISVDVARQIQHNLEATVVNVGEKELKNVKLPMEVCRIVLPWEKQPSHLPLRVTRSWLQTPAQVVAVVLLFLCLVIASTSFLRRHERASLSSTNTASAVSPPGMAPRLRSVAVKPLDYIAGDTNQMYLADGMTETLLRYLSDIRALRVPGRSTVMSYKGSSKTIKQMAAELEVDAIVEGSIQRDANRVLITVQLIEAASDRHLWSTNYVREMSDFFKVQSEVAQAIAAEIGVQLTPQDQRRLADVRPTVPAAVEAYLQGRHQWNRRAPEALRKAIDLFEKAVQLDPGFALGHAGLADAYCIAPATIDVPTHETYDKARAAAVRALELDDQLAEPHVSLGFLLANVDWKWREAETHFLQAIALKPDYPPAHYWYAYQLLVKQGRTNEALVQAQLALKLDPAASATRGNYTMVLIAAGRHEAAIRQAQIILELEPEFIQANWGLLRAYIGLGQYAEAIEAGKRFRAQYNRPWVWGVLGYAYAADGQKEPALKLLDELKGQTPIPRVPVAQIQAALGLKREALESLQLAYEERERDLAFLRIYPLFDRLRAEPRFQELLKKMELEP
ncbi:MAG: hypothetical protein HYY23_05475 [Verrucomicrobia bacterium]|nr:hypothetical protein [Verrucomicrobiota bacterium]